ncbi:hypothetical protein MHH33_17835 [Paenisporosarcina sp. FSL H8-0542]|uniref:hypothetical protein n=1 Tax=Paenisporosarcina sp. FSL H8-0542 TaxID=2921401 RepID=UPI003159FEBA
MKGFLIGSQIFYVLCLIPWFVIWGLSFMSFDNGFSVWNVSFVLAIGFYPIAVILCSIFSWILHIQRKRTAIIINLIPMLWVAGLGVLLLMVNFS